MKITPPGNHPDITRWSSLIGMDTPYWSAASVLHYAGLSRSQWSWVTRLEIIKGTRATDKNGRVKYQYSTRELQAVRLAAHLSRKNKGKVGRNPLLESIRLEVCRVLDIPLHGEPVQQHVIQRDTRVDEIGGALIYLAGLVEVARDGQVARVCATTRRLAHVIGSTDGTVHQHIIKYCEPSGRVARASERVLPATRPHGGKTANEYVIIISVNMLHYASSLELRLGHPSELVPHSIDCGLGNT